jgi:glycosyltransferase involved in cell wall biosynthesis
MISVVMPILNRVSLLKRGLPSIYTQDYPRENYEVIFVDYGSTDGLKEYLQALSGVLNLTYLRIDDSKAKIPVYHGPTGTCNPALAWNVGIRRARGNLIMLTSPEVIHVTETLWQADEVGKEGRVVRARVVDVPPWTQDLIDELHTFSSSGMINLTSSTERPDMAGLYFIGVVPKALLEKIGALDEDYMMGLAWEDTDAGQRMLATGAELYHADDMIGLHQWHPRVDLREDPYCLKNQVRHLREFKTVANVGRVWGDPDVIVDEWHCTPVADRKLPRFNILKPAKRLVGFVRTYNEVGRDYFDQFFDQAKTWGLDALFVLDDCSTDGTVAAVRKHTKYVWVRDHNHGKHYEIQNMMFLVDRCKEVGAQWMLWMDIDEVLTNRAGEIMKRLMEEGDKQDWSSVYFPEYNLWKTPRWRRRDMGWSCSTGWARLWRNDGVMFYDQAANVGAHLQLWPRCLDRNSFRTEEVAVLHYGYASKENIDAKWEEYTRLDSRRLFLYTRILDETNLVLQALPNSIFPAGLEPGPEDDMFPRWTEKDLDRIAEVIGRCGWTMRPLVEADFLQTVYQETQQIKLAGLPDITFAGTL